MFQVHGGFVDIVRTILIELGGFIGQITALAALLAVFHPQQTQGDAALLHLTMYPFVVRHLVLLAQCSGGIQLPNSLFCAAVLNLVPGKLLFCGPPKGYYDCAARTAAAFRNAGFVDPQAVKPEDLFVVDHGTSSCILVYISRCASTIQGYLTGGGSV